MNPEYNRRNFYEEFAPSIDLSYGKQISVNHLDEPACLQLASDTLCIFPELDAPLSQLMDYKIINLSAIEHYFNAQQIEFNDLKSHRLLSEIIFADRMSEMRYGLPPGVVILKCSQTLLIGRNSSPQLNLSADVSREHLVIANYSDMLIFKDNYSTNGSQLYLSSLDIQNIVPNTTAI